MLNINETAMLPVGARLTARELEVLSLVGIGKSNQEVARSMSVGPDTVKFHLRNIFRKLGARRRTEAVFKAGRIGLLPASLEH